MSQGRQIHAWYCLFNCMFTPDHLISVKAAADRRRFSVCLDRDEGHSSPNRVIRRYVGLQGHKIQRQNSDPVPVDGQALIHSQTLPKHQRTTARPPVPAPRLPLLSLAPQRLAQVMRNHRQTSEDHTDAQSTEGFALHQRLITNNPRTQRIIQDPTTQRFTNPLLTNSLPLKLHRATSDRQVESPTLATNLPQTSLLA